MTQELDYSQPLLLKNIPPHLFEANFGLCMRVYTDHNTRWSRLQPITTKVYFWPRKCEIILVHKQGWLYRREHEDGVQYEGLAPCFPLPNEVGKKFILIDEYREEA